MSGLKGGFEGYHPFALPQLLPDLKNSSVKKMRSVCCNAIQNLLSLNNFRAFGVRK
jgi:hypothetical protein